MIETINKLLLSGDTFMAEILLGQPGFTHSAFVPFTKNKERLTKIKETGDSRYIYQNKLDKNCSQHDMVYPAFKNIPRRIAADKAFNIANIQNMMDII